MRKDKKIKAFIDTHKPDINDDRFMEELVKGINKLPVPANLAKDDVVESYLRLQKIEKKVNVFDTVTTLLILSLIGLVGIIYVYNSQQISKLLSFNPYYLALAVLAAVSLGMILISIFKVKEDM